MCDKPIMQSRISWVAVLCSVAIFFLLMMLGQFIILRGNVIAGLCAVISSAGFYCINRVLDRHSARNEELEQSRSSGRCSVLTSGKAAVYSRLDILVFGTPFSWPLLVLFFAGIVLALFSFVSYVLYFPPGVLIAGIVALGIVVIGVRMMPETMRQRSELMSHYRFRGTVTEWACRHGVYIAAPALIIFIVQALIENMNYAVAGLVADGGWFPAYLCACGVASLLLSRCKMRVKWIDWLLYGCQIGIDALVCFLLLAGELRHTVYLILAGVMLIPLILAVGRMIARHNEFVTRPVPYFNQKGELK